MCLCVCLYVNGSSTAHRQDGPHVYYTKQTIWLWIEWTCKKWWRKNIVWAKIENRRNCIGTKGFCMPLCGISLTNKQHIHLTLHSIIKCIHGSKLLLYWYILVEQYKGALNTRVQYFSTRVLYNDTRVQEFNTREPNCIQGCCNTSLQSIQGCFPYKGALLHLSAHSAMYLWIN